MPGPELVPLLVKQERPLQSAGEPQVGGCWEGWGTRAGLRAGADSVCLGRAAVNEHLGSR